MGPSLSDVAPMHKMTALLILTAMATTPAQSDRPVVDKNAPANAQTATFALG